MLGNTEVQDFDVSLGRHHDVRGLQVAMHDLLLMGRIDRFGDLDPEHEQLAQPKRPLLEPLLQSLALDVLHGDEGFPFDLANLVDLADVGMIQRRRQLGFSQESFACDRVLFESLRQELDGHFAVQGRVLGEENLTHAPLAEGLQKLELI